LLTRDARAKERDTAKLAQATAKANLPQPMIIIQPRVAPLLPTKSNSTSVTRTGDSTVPGAAAKSPGTPVSAELRQPIEKNLKTAIESGLSANIETVYTRYEQDDQTKKYFKGIMDKADSVHVKSIVFRSSRQTGNAAQVLYRMTINVMTSASKQPQEVPSVWQADLVRDGPGAPWKIRQLTRRTLVS